MTQRVPEEEEVIRQENQEPASPDTADVDTDTAPDPVSDRVADSDNSKTEEEGEEIAPDHADVLEDEPTGSASHSAALGETASEQGEADREDAEREFPGNSAADRDEVSSPADSGTTVADEPQEDAGASQQPLASIEQWDSVVPGEETVADQESEADTGSGEESSEENPGEHSGGAETEETDESLMLTGESVEEDYAAAVERKEAAPAPGAEEHFELVQQLEYVAPSGKSARQQEDEEPELQFHGIAEARAVLEGFLFTSNEPLTVQRLSKLMSNLHPRTVRGLVLELQMEYDQRGGALQIVEIAGGFQMATRPHLADWMFRMHRHKRRSALSPATLETLAIVAYKQPITKGEVEAIRGVESSGTMRTLQDLNLVEASGRREVVGRPQLFITTDTFLKAFGLRSLADLPSISELRALFADDQKLKAATAKKVEPQPEVDPESSTAAAADATADASTVEKSRGAEQEGDASGVTSPDEELNDELLAETDELQELDQADEEDEDLEAEDQELEEELEDEDEQLDVEELDSNIQDGNEDELSGETDQEKRED